MKSINKNFHFVVLMLLLLPFKGLGQIEPPNDSLSIKLMSAAREIMTSAGTCALITLDTKGRPRARIMDAFLPENDFSVWFGTNPTSRKVSQITNDPRVTLYYAEANASGYVMIHGKATIVDDEKEKEVRWKDAWAPFYPNRSESYTLIHVAPEWMEVVSYAHGIVSNDPNWMPPSVEFESKK